MALRRAAWWSPYRASWDCLSGLSVWARRWAICCLSTRKNLWIRCSNKYPTPRRHGGTEERRKRFPSYLSVALCLHGHFIFLANLSDHVTDEQFLRRAIDLARAGAGQASPNPYVGAVIVDSRGSIVGEGTYTYNGLKHAEVL